MGIQGGTEVKKRYKFSGHETFPFRYGWLEKGVRGLLEHPDLFSRDDALVYLGVGKNMVESIRHWCTVAQLLEEDAESKKGTAAALRVSVIGKELLREGGWDPFLEDEASLWLIHWLIVSNPLTVTTWQIAFSFFQRPDFAKAELTDYVAAYGNKHSVKTTASSLSRDVDCFVRTYTAGKAKAKQAIAEEGFECPFQELNLVQASPDGEVYRFSVGPKPTLPAAVFGYALAQHFGRIRAGRETMAVQECLYGPGSPGQVFKLDENSFAELMEELAKISRGKLVLDETEALRQVYRRGSLDPFQFLRHHYEQARV